jgi:stringent starvation protein A
MQWWTAEPVVYTEDDYEGHRIRFLIGEKRARCATRILDRFNPPPDYLLAVNTSRIYPVLIDKNLLCHGAALEEILHERYPAPMILPADPVRRAQHRMLANQVRSWYSLNATDLAGRLGEVVAAYDGTTEFFIGDNISIVDIALGPLLWCVPWQVLDVAHGTPFYGYRERLISRPSFQLSLRPQVPVNEMEISDEDDEGDDDCEVSIPRAA